MKTLLLISKVVSAFIPFLIVLRIVLLGSGVGTSSAYGLCKEEEKKLPDSNWAATKDLEVEKERVRELLSSEISLLSSGLNANGAGLMQMRGIFFTVLTGAVAFLFTSLGRIGQEERIIIFVVLILALFVVFFYAYDGFVLSLQERVSLRVRVINASLRELSSIDDPCGLAEISTFPKLSGCVAEKIANFFLIRYEQALIFLPASLACIGLIWVALPRVNKSESK